jgi:hypothetical protein
MDVEVAADEAEVDAPSSPEPAMGEKICAACGELNEPFALLCSGTRCGADLRAEQAAIQDKPSEPVFQKPLLLLVGGQSFECRDGDILGREGSVAREAFASIETVSRRHVMLSRKENGWFIVVQNDVRNLSQLDGRDMSRGVAHPLTGAHILKMSSRCEVKLKVVHDEAVHFVG